jgi:UDP-N-acetylmuramoylalanine--D-glutamate ligase
MKLTRHNIHHAKVSILGAARSGMDAALLLKNAGAEIFLSEKAEYGEKESQASLLEKQGISFEFGGHTDRVFDADAIIVSPGIPDSNPIVVEAKSRKIEVLGELEIASWFCLGKIIAVTGSNGKSTTTTLIGEMLKHAGIPCVVAGNIGTTFSSQVDKIDDKGFAVIEVSNFQLETVRDFCPWIALYLNLTPDHLDRHGTVLEYGRIKARLFQNQTEEDSAIYNGQDAMVFSLLKDIRSRRLVFQIQNPKSDGAFVENGKLTLRIGKKKHPIIPEEEMGIPGPHNTENGLAAALAAFIAGTPADSIGDVLRNFHGLSHRMELIRQIGNIRWYNDSKATNVDSMQCALRSFQTPIILIAGGRDKNSDFTVLRKLLHDRTRSVILIGEAAEKMKKAWQGDVSLQEADSMDEAVMMARTAAQDGDVVLLSPGCASFDMFENFEDRGNQFKARVLAL